MREYSRVSIWSPRRLTPWVLGTLVGALGLVMPLWAQCYDGICAGPIVCNECGHWEDDHHGHTAPPEIQHDAETADLFPLRPSGGASPFKDYDVTVIWRSYHRAMNQGIDGGHCADFCAVGEQPFNQCSNIWRIDGLGLQPEKIERKGGTSATTISHARIDGPYQNHEGKWEWPERGFQYGPPFNSCSFYFSSNSHEWTSRPTDILTAKFRVNDWNGSSWNTNPDYELFWDEDDGTDNDDLDFRVTPNQPGVVALDRAVEDCLEHGVENQRFTLHRDAVLMLCENRNWSDRCDDHLFEIWFDVQCKWKERVVQPPSCSGAGEPCLRDFECCSGDCQFVFGERLSFCSAPPY